ncbi:MAG: polyprenyl synthetase family protein [Phycisphaerae bacterium]|jgi:octaprenyl-diphosphate synthase
MQTYYEQLSGEFERELADVRKIITEKSAFLRTYGIENSPFSAGKLMRPLLCLCSQNPTSPSTLKYAAAIELVHNASLIHDDIIDRSQTRRHLPAFQETYGKETAILAGDALMGIAFRLCIAECGNVETLGLSNSVNAMCAAELQQQLAIKTKRFSAEESLDIIRGKTGSLFRACAEGCGDEAMRAAELCGMAFQISNDIADIEDDLKNGLQTLPLLLNEAPESSTGYIDRCRGLAAAKADELLDKALCLSANSHGKINTFVSVVRELIRC